MKLKIAGICSVVMLLGVFTCFIAHHNKENPGNNPLKSVANGATTQLKSETNKPKNLAGNSLAYSSDIIKTPGLVSSQRDNKIVTKDKEYPLRLYKTLLAPNDPLASQWWVANSRLNEAWDIPAGSTETVLAIIDTGFGLNHEDFLNRWYVNTGESGSTTNEAVSTLNCSDRSLPVSANCNLIDDNGDGIVDNEIGLAIYENPSRLNCSDQAKPLNKNCNQIDDDANGFVDDVTGWDFINYDNSVQAGELNQNGSGTMHGTMVTGVAAATGNNDKGLAGVDWNTKILPIQALNDDSYGDSLSVSRAIAYAANIGADVINISLGSEHPDDYVRQAVQAAIAKGSVVVAATGNDGCDCMLYPANYPEVVSVGSLNSTNTPASFSSWGANLDILAPGTQMNTTNWTSVNDTSAYAYGVNGTSFATPFVSGLLTRLLSQQPQANALQLIAALTENTNRLNLGDTSPKSNTLGFGAVDTYKASNRMAYDLNSEQIYNYTPVSKGNHPVFSISETTTSYSVQACQDNAIGTTPIFELTKSSSKFFSISQVEVWKAQQAGYAPSLFAYGCLQQPQDTATVSRNIDIFHEFKNVYTKIQY